MKKRFKGFTLIECLVALGILGIASLTMAQIYANVARKNKMNHLVNTSLSNQMAYVERYTNSEAVQVSFSGDDDKLSNTSGTKSGTPPHVNDPTGNFNYVITKFDDPDNLSATESYSYPADIYVLKSRTRGDVKMEPGDGGDMGYTEDNFNLRYKYIIGH